MSYRRRTTRRTRYVQPKQKYSGFYQSQPLSIKFAPRNAGDVGTFSNYTLIRNLSNTGAFAPPVQKVKHLKCVIDIPLLVGDRAFTYCYIDAYVVYVPQGSINSILPGTLNDEAAAGTQVFTNRMDLVQNHPEWVMAHTTGVGSINQMTRMYLNSKLTRNLNTGDEIVLLIGVKTDISTQVQIATNIVGINANISWSYYTRSN